MTEISTQLKRKQIVYNYVKMFKENVIVVIHTFFVIFFTLTVLVISILPFCIEYNDEGIFSVNMFRLTCMVL